MHNHPYVSEAHEGKPWFEWCVLGVVAVITLLVAFGYTMAATVILAVTAIITGLVRLILQDRSHGKCAQWRSTPSSASPWESAC